MAEPAPLLEITRSAGEKNAGSYIVRLKEDVDESAHLAWLRPRLTDGDEVTHEYFGFLHGYAARLSEATLDHLRASPDVESISEDAIGEAHSVENKTTWGLARICQREKLKQQDASKLTFEYNYDASAGKGVDIYILDSGIRTTHEEFRGRVEWGWAAPGASKTDKTGHGTKVAGAAAGSKYGVAKEAKLIAVKVNNKDEKPTGTNLIAGMKYVSDAVQFTGRPSIVNMSIGFKTHQQDINDAVYKLFQAGIHVVVSAGNEGVDAKDMSPADSRYCTTVGASTIADTRTPESNYGSVLNIFAPGTAIYTASNGADDSFTTSSGTSFAAPYVSGLIAYMITTFKLRGKSAKDVREFLIEKASDGKLSGIPSGTPNKLAYNAYTGNA